nr:unnamed protein product [Spirometra erinaceieuropaei]
MMKIIFAVLSTVMSTAVAGPKYSLDIKANTNFTVVVAPPTPLLNTSVNGDIEIEDTNKLQDGKRLLTIPYNDKRTPDHSGCASAQASDPYISLIYDRLRLGAPKPSSEEMKGSSWKARCLWSAWSRFRLCDGVLFLQYSSTDPRRLVLPHDAIHPKLSGLHVDLGHAAQPRTDTAARQRFWGSNQRRIIQDTCNTCPVCAEVKNPNPTQRAPLQPIQTCYLNEVVDVDLMGPMPPSSGGNRYVLVLVDFFTKWCAAVPLPQADAMTVAKAILSEWFCRHGMLSGSILARMLSWSPG